MSDITLDQYIKDQLTDPKFEKAWKKGEVSYQVTRELIKARIERKISQRQLAQKANTTQAVISRVENMTANPSIGLLQKIAKALGKNLEVKFT